jgi:hypothetical protein
MSGKEAIEILEKELKEVGIAPVMDHPLNRKYHMGIIAGLRLAIDKLESQVFIGDLIEGKIPLVEPVN